MKVKDFELLLLSLISAFKELIYHITTNLSQVLYLIKLIEIAFINLHIPFHIHTHALIQMHEHTRHLLL